VDLIDPHKFISSPDCLAVMVRQGDPWAVSGFELVGAPNEGADFSGTGMRNMKSVFMVVIPNAGRIVSSLAALSFKCSLFVTVIVTSTSI